MKILKSIIYFGVCLVMSSCVRTYMDSTHTDKDRTKVPVFTRFNPYIASINMDAETYEDEVNTVQVVSNTATENFKLTETDYFNISGKKGEYRNLDQNQAKISFIPFLGNCKAAFIANLPKADYKLDGGNSIYNESTAISSLDYCRPPFVMSCEEDNLSYDLATQIVSQGGSRLEYIGLVRSVGALDLSIVINPSYITAKLLTGIKVEKVEVLNVPKLIGLMQPLDNSFYNNSDNFLAYYDGNVIPNLETVYTSEKAKANFIKTQFLEGEVSYKNNNTTESTNGIIVPRIYLPENMTIDKSLETIVRITFSQDEKYRYFYLHVGKPEVGSDSFGPLHIHRNVVYKLSLLVKSLQDPIEINSFVLPWDEVAYGQDFDLDPIK